MTIWQLKRLLDINIAKHGKRIKVVLDPRTFAHSLPEVNLFDVCDGKVGVHPELNDDGSAVNKDGLERLRTYLVLYGNAGQPCCGRVFTECKCNAERT